MTWDLTCTQNIANKGTSAQGGCISKQTIWRFGDIYFVIVLESLNVPFILWLESDSKFQPHPMVFN